MCQNSAMQGSEPFQQWPIDSEDVLIETVNALYSVRLHVVFPFSLA